MNPDYNLCPPLIQASLRRYDDYRIPLGDFLLAVLSNNLKEAFMTADDDNRAALLHIVAYCYYRIPSPCWGSPDNVRNWLKRSQDAAEAAKLT